jgi:hypothetical protein
MLPFLPFQLARNIPSDDSFVPAQPSPAQARPGQASPFANLPCAPDRPLPLDCVGIVIAPLANGNAPPHRFLDLVARRRTKFSGLICPSSRIVSPVTVFRIGFRLAVSRLFGIPGLSTLDCALHARFPSVIQDPLALPGAFLFLETIQNEQTSFCNDRVINQAMMIQSAIIRNEIVSWALGEAFPVIARDFFRSLQHLDNRGLFLIGQHLSIALSSGPRARPQICGHVLALSCESIKLL